MTAQQELTMRKVADQLGLVESTVASHVHRGLKNLRRVFMTKGTCSKCGRTEQPLIKGLCQGRCYPKLIKGLCQGRCYPKSRRLAKLQEEQETQKEPIKLTPPVKSKEIVSKKVLSIDFTEYPQVYDQLIKEAKNEVRDPEKQVLWLLIQHFSEDNDQSYNEKGDSHAV